ncbi:MAG: FecR domain-containing protein [Lachnospiraceae bacterium]|nr:FecR domain-containing protein [Lachnospiraceae bacterium]
MFCSKCGNEIEEGELFCGNCGTPVSEMSVSPEKEGSSADGSEVSFSEVEKSEAASGKADGRKWNKTGVVIAVFFIWLLLVAGLAFMIYSIVMKASTMRLSSYTGDVTLTGENGKVLELKEDKRLFGGNKLVTGKESKAYVLLDEDRFVTLMERSTADFIQRGDSISISLEEGDLFFNIARDLKEDESLEISVSTMIIGIRGTSGYVRENEDGYPVLYMTSGKVMAYAVDPDSGNTDQRKIRAGQKLTVIITDGEIQMIVEDIEASDLPMDAIFEITADRDLLNEVVEDTGWDKEILKELKSLYESGDIPDDGTDSSDSFGPPDTSDWPEEAFDIVGTWDLSPTMEDTLLSLQFNRDATGIAKTYVDGEFHEIRFYWNWMNSGSLYSVVLAEGETAAGIDGLFNVECWGDRIVYHSSYYLSADADSQSGSPASDNEIDQEIARWVVGTWHDPEDFIKFTLTFYEDGTGTTGYQTFNWSVNNGVLNCDLFDGDSVQFDSGTILYKFEAFDRYGWIELDKYVLWVPDTFAVWTYDDYEYYSERNGDYKDPITGSKFTLYIGTPAGAGTGSGCGRMVFGEDNAFISYYGDGMFYTDYDGGMYFWLTDDDFIRVQYPDDPYSYFFEKT